METLVNKILLSVYRVRCQEYSEYVASHSREKLHAKLQTSLSEITCSQTDTSFAGHRSHQVIF